MAPEKYFKKFRQRVQTNFAFRVREQQTFSQTACEYLSLRDVTLCRLGE